MFEILKSEPVLVEPSLLLFIEGLGLLNLSPLVFKPVLDTFKETKLQACV